MAVKSAFRCDGAGHAEAVEVGGAAAAELAAGAGFVWLHLHRPDAGETDWLTQSGLDALVQEALDAPETRPRCTVMGEGLLVNLRGVNLSEGAEPEDMVSLRLWVTGHLMVSVQRREVRAVDDVRGACLRNAAPRDTGELVARLALRLADRAEPVVADLNERIDDLEEELNKGQPPMRGDLADVRRVSIMLRRYMFPLRDALSTFSIEDMEWLRDHARERVREAAERATRLAEDLDAIRDRAEVVHDQIMDIRAEANNRQMLVLSVVAAIFLPLGLLTGLLGINVGGVPGSDDPYAFWIVCLLLAVVCTGQILLYRRLGLLGAGR